MPFPDDGLVWVGEDGDAGDARPDLPAKGPARSHGARIFSCRPASAPRRYVARSRHANMKEMRFSAADGKWPLVAGDKSGVSERRKRPVRTVFPRQSKPVILEEWEVREARKWWSASR
jgi:hypothetical protein